MFYLLIYLFIICHLYTGITFGQYLEFDFIVIFEKQQFIKKKSKCQINKILSFDLLDE